MNVPEQILENGRIIISDIAAIISGVFGFIVDCFRNDAIPLSLSIFSCGSRFVKQGEHSDYLLTIANNTAVEIIARYRIEIESKNESVSATGNYASFSGECAVPRTSSVDIQLVYDWDTRAVVISENERLPVIGFLRGSSGPKGKFNVIATLCDQRNREIEKLMIVQEIAG